MFHFYIHGKACISTHTIMIVAIDMNFVGAIRLAGYLTLLAIQAVIFMQLLKDHLHT